MTANELKTIRTHLESEKQRLTEQLEDARADQSEGRRDGSPFGKREEEATATAELENRMALEKRILSQLAGIECALTNIGNGTYGICEICGKAINPKRMEALPQATMCVDCKSNRAKNGKI